MEDFTLDELDYKILNLISNDTRVSFLEVSRICNISGAAVHQRVKKMITNNVITGSEFKINLKMIGHDTCAYLSLRFNQSIDDEIIINKLKAIPEITECNITIGQHQFFVKIFTRNNSHLYDIIEHQIKPMGLLEIDTTIIYGEVFHRQITF